MGVVVGLRGVVSGGGDGSWQQLKSIPLKILGVVVGSTHVHVLLMLTLSCV